MSIARATLASDLSRGVTASSPAGARLSPRGADRLAQGMGRAVRSPAAARFPNGCPRRPPPPPRALRRRSLRRSPPPAPPAPVRQRKDHRGRRRALRMLLRRFRSSSHAAGRAGAAAPVLDVLRATHSSKLSSSAEPRRPTAGTVPPRGRARRLAPKSSRRSSSAASRRCAQLRDWPCRGWFPNCPAIATRAPSGAMMSAAFGDLLRRRAARLARLSSDIGAARRMLSKLLPFGAGQFAQQGHVRPLTRRSKRRRGSACVLARKV